MSLFHSYTSRIFSVFASVVFMTGLLMLVGPVAHAAGPNSPTVDGLDRGIDQCAWRGDSLITCGDEEFWYDMNLSVTKGRAIFHYKKDGNWQPAYLYFNSSGDLVTLTNSPDISTNGNDSDLIDREKSKLYLAGNATGNETGVGSDGKVQGVYVYCGLETKAGYKCISGRGGEEKGPIATETASAIKSQRENLGDAISSEERCDADLDGLLSFIFCPLLNYSQEAVENLIGTSADGSQRGYLVELMTISPMTQATDSNLYNVWKAFRDLSLGLYILVFIVIIFGNGLGMDAYTIKRTLPRLATASVLTMASFFIVQFMVDFSNLLGAGLPALISNITNGDANIANFSLDLGAGGSALGIILLIIFSLVALVAVLVGMAGLIFRQIAVYILVIISPLAFVAWVLPNTESLFKKWWSNMLKLCAMFPIITGMIAMSLLFQKSLDTQSASLPLKLAATLAPLMALINIPNTFKWGGELFAAGAGFLAGRASSGVDFAKGQSKDRLSNTFKDGAGARLTRSLGTKTDADGSNRRSRVTFGAVPAVGGAIERKRAIKQAKRDVAINKRLGEGLDDVGEAGLANIWNNLSPKRREGAFGQNVKTELNKKKGKAMGEYASALRDGRFDDANRQLTKIGIVDGALSPELQSSQNAAGRRAIPAHSTVNGNPVPVQNDSPIVSGSSAAQINTIRDRINSQVRGNQQNQSPNPAVPFVGPVPQATPRPAAAGSPTPAAAPHAPVPRPPAYGPAPASPTPTPAAPTSTTPHTPTPAWSPAPQPTPSTPPVATPAWSPAPTATPTPAPNPTAGWSPAATPPSGSGPTIVNQTFNNTTEGSEGNVTGQLDELGQTIRNSQGTTLGAVRAANNSTNAAVHEEGDQTRTASQEIDRRERRNTRNAREEDEREQRYAEDDDPLAPQPPASE